MYDTSSCYFIHKASTTTYDLNMYICMTDATVSFYAKQLPFTHSVNVTSLLSIRKAVAKCAKIMNIVCKLNTLTHYYIAITNHTA